MKNTIIRAAFAMFAIAITILISSCQQASSPVSPISSNTNSPSIVKSNLTNSTILTTDYAVLEATTDNEMVFCGDTNRNTPGMGDSSRKHLEPKHPIFLGGEFRKLGLSLAQDSLIWGYMGTFMSCEKSAMQSTQAQRLALVQAANDQRKAVLDSLKGNLITKTIARSELNAINQQVRSALNTLDQSVMCPCLLSFYASIRSALTTDQQVTWDAWVATLKGSPCFP